MLEKGLDGLAGGLVLGIAVWLMQRRNPPVA